MKKQDSEKTDIFDKIMCKGFLRKFKPFYTTHKETLLYLFFGGCTTIISLVSFAVSIKLMNLPNISLFGININTNIQVSNIISWICAVTIAYITNRIWVFTEKANGIKAIVIECTTFFTGRIFTLITENILLNILYEKLNLNETISKIAVLTVTIILNYIISKSFVFKNRNAQKEEDTSH